MSKKYGGSLLNSLSNINISSATQHFHHEDFFQGRVKILTLIDQTLTPYFTVTSIRIFLCNLLVVFSFCFTFWLGLFVPETKNLILCLFNLSLRVSKKKPICSSCWCWPAYMDIGWGTHIDLGGGHCKSQKMGIQCLSSWTLFFSLSEWIFNQFEWKVVYSVTTSLRFTNYQDLQCW